MENWSNNLEMVIQRIDPYQLSKVIEIGKILKEGLSSDSSNHILAIQKAEKELYQNFDDSSCQVLLSIIGSSSFFLVLCYANIWMFYLVLNSFVCKLNVTS
jgi:hypothetical protein